MTDDPKVQRLVADVATLLYEFDWLYREQRQIDVAIEKVKTSLDAVMADTSRAKPATRSFVVRLLAQRDNPDKDGLLSLLFSVGEAERIFAEWPDVSEIPASPQELIPVVGTSSKEKP